MGCRSWMRLPGGGKAGSPKALFNEDLRSCGLPRAGACKEVEEADMIRKIALGVVAVAVMVGSGVAQAEVKIKDLSGIVRVAAAGTDKFSQVVPGQILAEGMEVRTGENGRVTIQLGPNNLVRLRGNAKIVIRTHQAKVSRFNLLQGKLKGIFASLTGGERFELEFGSGAVASVKGTVFTAEETQNGAILHTLFGSMSLVFNGREYDVPQGTGASMESGRARAALYILTEAHVRAGLPRASARARARANLHSFVQSAEKQARRDQKLVNEVREDDFAVGRTLKDYHGNVVRVDQRLLRPDPRTIQFVNLVQRDEYRYRGKYTYNGVGGPRYDYLMGEISFNMDLPNSVMDWPEFFVANSDTVELLSARMELANGGPRDPNRDMIARTYTNQDDAPGTNNDAVIEVNGRDVVFGDNADVPNSEQNGADSGDLWGAAMVQGYYDTNGNGNLDLAEMTAANRLVFSIEGYALNEDGGVLNVNDFTENGMQDPFGFARTVAAEAVVSVADASGYLFGRGGTRPSNIDIVIIPDLAVAIVTRYGASIMAMDGDVDLE